MSLIDEIMLIAPKLPVSVLEDINKRVNDWIVSGGGENDMYILSQLNYAKRVVAHLEREQGDS